ncbi:MAG: SelB C-terminal domain-containing protein, partial [Syntrophomonas sp.]|nr:SelB C-terminal domain-containing protein [Syntrophomonas sp.]
RLPIDRVFTIAGFGTVVTGTLWSGQIRVGDTMELLPVQKAVKVRTLQVHNEKVGTAYAGQRVAVNLQGIEVSDIKRGYLLAETGFLIPSYRVDTKLRLLEESSRILRNWNRVRFHLGTDEALGRVVLLDRDELGPGEEAYAQIVMEKPVVAFKGDPFVVRYYSPVDTIGGGTVIDPNAPKQKRFKEDVLNDLAVKEEGSLYDLILHELENSPQPLSLAELTKRTGNPEMAVRDEIQLLLDDEKIVNIENKGGLFLSIQGLEILYEQIVRTMDEFRRKYPLRSGYPKEDMRTRLFGAFNPKSFNSLIKYLEAAARLVTRSNLISVPGWVVEPRAEVGQAVAAILQLMRDRPFAPPEPEEMSKAANVTEGSLSEILAYLVEQDQLVKISDGTYFTRAAIEKGRQLLGEYFDREKELSLATARDILDTSRKYALPLIEYYDRIRFTRRVGDVRVKYSQDSTN